MEFSNAARQAAIEESLANAVKYFCSSGHVVVATIAVATEERIDGGLRIGRELVLEREDGRRSFQTTAHVFGRTARSVSREAWELNASPAGRRIIDNIVAVGRTVDSSSGRTVFSLATDRRIPFVVAHVYPGR